MIEKYHENFKLELSWKREKGVGILRGSCDCPRSTHILLAVRVKIVRERLLTICNYTFRFCAVGKKCMILVGLFSSLRRELLYLFQTLSNIRNNAWKLLVCCFISVLLSYSCNIPDLKFFGKRLKAVSQLN